MTGQDPDGGQPQGMSGFYDLLGTTYQVESPSRDIADELSTLLAPFSCAPRAVPSHRHFRLISGCRATGAGHGLYRGERLEVQDDGWAIVLEELLTQLNREAIDGYDGFAAHAGVVSMAGRATAFPAASGQGKSSLVAASLLAGFDYVSDEALCVDLATTAVCPYPRALGLSPWSCETLGLTRFVDQSIAKVPVPPSALGAVAVTAALSLAHIVKLRRLPVGGQAKLVAAPQREAALWLLQRSFNHYKRPQGSFDLAVELSTTSKAWYLDYSDLAAAAALVRERLADA